MGWGRKVARRIATAVAIKLTLRLLSRIGMGAAIASAGWLAGIVVSLGLLVVEELLIAAVDKHRLRYETHPDDRSSEMADEKDEHRQMPERIPDTAENIAQAVLNTPPAPDGEAVLRAAKRLANQT